MKQVILVIQNFALGGLIVIPWNIYYYLYKKEGCGFAKGMSILVGIVNLIVFVTVIALRYYK